MAQKADAARKKTAKAPGILGGVPFGIAMDVVDSLGGVFFKYFLDRYRLEDKIEQVKEDAKQKAGEIKAEAIKTGIALKKAVFRTIVEAIFLTTGLLALIIGVMLIVSDVIPLKYVLVVYGAVTVAVIAIILWSQK
ncbi:MAG: hypothetical protein V1875_05130 [Candidatus Altiarchaeota archaeon]